MKLHFMFNQIFPNKTQKRERNSLNDQKNIEKNIKNRIKNKTGLIKSDHKPKPILENQ